MQMSDRHYNPFVFHHLCNLADESVTHGSVDSLRLARLCCRIAARLGTKDARARSFARLAAALRLVNRLQHADRALKIAIDAAPTHIKGDVLRRRAFLRIYQGRLAEAQEDAEAALPRTTGREHAYALEASGAAHYYSGEYGDASRQFGKCLDETHPDDASYCNAIQNYATALAEGTDKDVLMGLELCEEARRRLKPRHKMQRAKLWWTIGLLRFRLGKDVEAWRALDIARRSLIALQTAPEVAAIIADMARVDPTALAIRQICFEAGELITARHPLTKPLRTLGQAASEAIPEAAAALREEASRLAPCPTL